MFLALLIWAINPLYAQEDYKAGKSISLQTDAFDFMAKGASIWAAYTANYNRVFLDGGINELPDFLNPQSDDFIERRKYFVQTGYYRFLKNTNGLFIGAELIFQQMEISSTLTNEIQDNPVLRAAPVVGYEFTPFKASLPQFSITPWTSLRLPLYSQSVSFTSTVDTYKTADINFVMGLNLSYRIWTRQ